MQDERSFVSDNAAGIFCLAYCYRMDVHEEAS